MLSPLTVTFRIRRGRETWFVLSVSHTLPLGRRPQAAKFSYINIHQQTSCSQIQDRGEGERECRFTVGLRMSVSTSWHLYIDMKYASGQLDMLEAKRNNGWLGWAEYPPSMTLHGSHLLSPSDVYLNMVLGHIKPSSILTSSSVTYSAPHLVSICHFLLHNSEAIWAGMSAWLKGSPAQTCSLKKGTCVSHVDSFIG